MARVLHVDGGRDTVLVAGGGDFIGGHLARALSEQGFSVRAVDIKPFGQWCQIHDGVQACRLDLSKLDDCREAVRGMDTVYNLAANIGGIAFINSHKAECLLSVLINTHLLLAARDAGLRRYSASSACVYNANRQADPPLGVRGRNSDNTMFRTLYNWEPTIGLAEGLERTYRSIFDQLTAQASAHTARSTVQARLGRSVPAAH